jgi:hypothetical protein
MTNDETIQRNTALFDYYNSATGNRVKKTAKMFDMRSEEAWYIIRDARKGIGIIPPKPTVHTGCSQGHRHHTAKANRLRAAAQLP